MITFRLLGSVEVVHDDAAIPLGGPKQRALLAVLLLNANRAVSTDQIADALSREHVPANAAKSLQMSIARLRRSLEPLAEPDTGASVLQTVHGGYLLAVPGEPPSGEQMPRGRLSKLANCDTSAVVPA